MKTKKILIHLVMVFAIFIVFIANTKSANVQAATDSVVFRIVVDDGKTSFSAGEIFSISLYADITSASGSGYRNVAMKFSYDGNVLIAPENATLSYNNDDDELVSPDSNGLGWYKSNDITNATSYAFANQGSGTNAFMQVAITRTSAIAKLNGNNVFLAQIFLKVVDPIPSGTLSTFLTEFSGTPKSSAKNSTGANVTNVTFGTPSVELAFGQPSSDIELGSITVDGSIVSNTSSAKIENNTRAFTHTASKNDNSDVVVNASKGSVTAVALEAGAGTVSNIALGTGSFRVNYTNKDSEVSVKVTMMASDGVTEYFFKLTVKASGYDDATLSDLTFARVNGYDIAGLPKLTTEFSSTTKNYILQISASMTQVSVTPTATDASHISGIKVNGNTVASDSSYNVSVSNGSTISVVVTAQDTSKTETYTITVSALSDDVQLTSLTIIPEVSLNKTASANHTALTYTASGLLFTDGWFKVTAVTKTGQQVKIDTDSFASGSVTSSSSFDFGADAVLSKDVTIIIKAESGYEATYTLTVTRSEAEDDFNLSELRIYKGNSTVAGNLVASPALSSVNSGINFVLDPSLDFTQSGFTIWAKVNGKYATLTFNSSPITPTGDSSYYQFSNYIAATEYDEIIVDVIVIVTAQDGSTNQFTITVKRAPADTDTSLSSIKVEDKDNTVLSLSEDSNTWSADNKIPYANNSLSITAVIGKSTSAMTITDVTSGGSSALATNTRKTFSLDDSIKNEYTFVYEITVTAQNPTVSTKYTIRITREAAETDNGIKSLIARGTLDSVDYSNTTSSPLYTFEVKAASGYQVWIILETESGKAKVTIDGSDYSSTKPYSVGSAGRELDVVVTAEDGTPAYYKINLNQADERDPDDSITGITIDGYSYFPIFDQGYAGAYELNVPYTTSSVKITVTTGSNKATLITSSNITWGSNKSGNVNLTPGVTNTFTFQAESEKKTQSIVYIIEIYREEGVTDNYLEDLKINTGSGLNTIDGFDKDDFDYELRVDRTVTSVNLEFKAVDKASASVHSGNPANLQPGRNDIVIRVLSETGVPQDYTVTVWRANTEHEILSIVVKDKDGNPLYDVDDNLAPTFNSATKKYTFTVPYVCSQVYFEINLADNNMVSIGTDYRGLQNLSASGVKTFVIQYKSDYANFNSSINDQNSIDYTYEIIREEPDTETGIASLKVVGVSNSTAYDYDTLSGNQYTFVIPTAAGNKVTIDLVKASELSKYEVRLDGDTTFLEYNSSTQYSVKSTGTTVLNIRVTPQSGPSVSYSVLISQKDEKDDNTNISNIYIVGLPDVMTYNKNTTSYPISVPYSTTLVEIVVDFESNKTNFNIDPLTKTTTAGNKTLSEGVNTFKFQAKAENGALGQIYELVITRATGRTGNYLTSLSIDGVPVDGFDETIQPYTIQVDNYVVGPNISYTYSDGASVKLIAGTPDALEPGKNVIIYTVTSETGLTRNYTLNIYRNDNDYDISNITLKDNDGNNLLTSSGDVPPSFSTGPIFETFSVPYSCNVIYFDVLFSASASFSSESNIASDGKKSLAVGTNTIKIQVISSYGKANPSATEQTKSDVYIYTIIREEPNDDITLKKLQIQIGTDTYIPNFDPLDNTYTVENIPETETLANITYLKNHDTQKITGQTGSQTLNLSAGQITFIIYVNAESGDVGQYFIVVSRESVNLDDNNTITGISVMGSDGTSSIQLLTNYDPLNPYYPITIPANMSTISITATKLSEKATITGNGTKNPPVGQTTTYIVQCTSESGKKGTEYTIVITREAYDDDATLNSLTVNGSMVSGFTPDNYGPYEYKAHASTSVDIAAVVNALGKATIKSGVGTKTLAYGMNTVSVVVQPENPALPTVTYIINILRDSPTTLNSLVVDMQSLSPSFDPDIKEYSVSVPYSLKEININATKTSNNTTLTGVGKHTLTAGQVNKFEVVVTAECGTHSTTYVINVNVASGETGNYLEGLSVNGTPVAGWSKYTNEYDVVLSRTTQNVEFIYGEISKNATLTKPNDLSTIPTGKKTFLIVVTSEVGIPNTYEINVYCADTNFNINNISLVDTQFGLHLKNSEGTQALVFNKDTLPYEIKLPYSTSTFKIVTEKQSDYAVETFKEIQSIGIGETKVYEVYVTSEYGILNPSATGTKSLSYKLVITRMEADDNNKLKSLSVSGLTLSPAFDPSINSYVIDNIGSVASVFVSAETQSPNATVKGIGNITLNSGSSSSSDANFITITVTSESGVTNEYIIALYRNDANLQDSNDITNIKVIGSDQVNYLTDYNAVNLGTYTITLPSAVSGYTIIVSKPNGAFSTVYGDGSFTISQGVTKTHTVYATSESGIEGAHYIIEVTRLEASSNTDLLWIKVDGEELPGFSVEKPTYSVYRINAVTTVDISAQAADPKTTIVGTGDNLALAVGTNPFTIIVKAENGEQRFYIISVTREAPNPLLSNLFVNGYKSLLDSNNKSVDFNPETLEYYLTVNYEVLAIDPVYISNAQNATYTVNGKENLKVGMNEVTITVMIPSGLYSTYTIYVKRRAESSSNTNASNIIIDEISAYQYSNDIDEYYQNASEKISFEVANSIRNLTVRVFLEMSDSNDEYATYKVYNDKNLRVGENILIIIITAADGVSYRVISIHVLRRPMSFTVDKMANKNVTVAEVEGAQLEYTVNIGKNNISDIDFSQFIDTNEILDIRVISDKNNSNEIFVSVSDGDETVFVKFNCIRDVSAFDNWISSQSGSTFLWLLLICVLILLITAYLVNKDKFGKVVSKGKNKSKKMLKQLN